MATSFTDRLKLAKQDNADNIGAWEVPLNQGFDDADDRLFRSGAVRPIGEASPGGDADYIGQRFFDTVTKLWYTATAAGTPGTWIQATVGQAGSSVPSIAAGTAAGLPVSATPAGRWYIETDTLLLKRDNGTIWQTIQADPTGMDLPFGYISGFQLENARAPLHPGGDDDFDIVIQGGACRSASDTVNIKQPIGTSMTKRLDAVWAAGDGNGGLFSGTIDTNKWYHIFGIVKDSDSTVDFGFDIDLAAANIPAGYTEYRRLGSVKTNSTPVIFWFEQLGNRFNWYTPKHSVNLIEPAISATATLHVVGASPLGLKNLFYGNWHIDRNAGKAITWVVYISDPDTIDFAPMQSGVPAGQFDMSTFASGSPIHVNQYIEVRTNLLNEVRIRLNDQNTPADDFEIDAFIMGYVDERGQDGQGMI